MLGFLILSIGILIIIAGFILMLISSVNKLLNNEKVDEYTLNSNYDNYNSSSDGDGHGPVPDKKDVRGGGLIMLGPIPIIIGSDTKSARTLVILVIVLMLLYFFIFM